MIEREKKGGNFVIFFETTMFFLQQEKGNNFAILIFIKKKEGILCNFLYIINKSKSSHSPILSFGMHMYIHGSTVIFQQAFEVTGLRQIHYRITYCFW